MGHHVSGGRRAGVVALLAVLTFQPAALPSSATTDAVAQPEAPAAAAPVEASGVPEAPRETTFSDTFKRLYFTTSSYPGQPAVPFSLEWDNTSSTGRARLSDTPLNSVDGSHNPPHGASVHNKAHRQFLYRLTGSGTIDGWVRAFMRTRTRTGVGINEAAQDMMSQMTIRVVDATGTVVRGTALHAYNPPSSAGQSKWDAWTFRNRKFPAPGRWEHPLYGARLDAVSYSNGDYLVVEIGLRNFNATHVTGGHTWYNDKAASDVVENEADTTNLRSWIEFSPPSPTSAQMLGNCAAGHGTCPWHLESDPINTATGNYVSSATDLSLPGRGLPLSFTRTYNSLAYQPPAAVPPPANLVRFPEGGTASYTASRQYSAAYAPPFAANGVTGNTDAGNATWAVNAWQPGDWWQVSWSQAQSIDRILLCDRRTGSYYFGSAGRITFSDGSTVNWSGLPNDCGSTGANVLSVTFPRKTGITWFRVIGDTGGLGNAGLAEVEAYDDAGALEDYVHDLPEPLGAGWTHSYDAKLEIGSDGGVTFHTEDGAQIAYWPGGGSYSVPNGSYSTLAKLGDGTYEVTRRDQVVYRFGADGRLTGLVDRNSNQLSFSYTGGDLTTITDTVGRTVSLSYTDGRLTSLSAPPNRTITYGYDALNRLTTVTDARGKVWTYTYDALNRLETATDPNNHVVVTNEYGPDGRISAQTDARGKRGTFAWDPATGISTYTDARGKAWNDHYERGRLVRQEDPLGNETTYSYDADFNLTSVTDPRGHSTGMTYDAAGNLLTRTAPAPFSTSSRGHTRQGTMSTPTLTGGRTAPTTTMTRRETSSWRALRSAWSTNLNVTRMVQASS